MPNQPAEADVRSRGSAAVVALRGDINGAADEVLAAAYEDAEAMDPGVIVLNFEDVSYINSTGIALIVSLLARARTKKIEVRACGLTDHYRHIFEVTRLSDFMPMFGEESAAVA